MKLLIDIGNTRLKWALSHNIKFESNGVVDNAGIASTILHEHWAKLPRPSSVGIACVSAELIFITVTRCLNELWPAIEIKRLYAQAQCLGVQNAYQHPEKLGVDRWLALLAAHHSYKGCIGIIDCGTAITIDIVHADGIHVGGYITPGLTLMQQALSARTGLVSATVQSSLQAGKTTEAAIYAGTLLTAVALINAVPHVYPDIDQLILTGGDATTVAQYVSVACHLEVDLVLHGLALAMT